MANEANDIGGEPGAAAAEHGEPVWTVEAAIRRANEATRRIVAGKPLSKAERAEHERWREADDAYFWWDALNIELTFKAVQAVERLKTSRWWKKLRATVNKNEVQETYEAKRAIQYFMRLDSLNYNDLIYELPIGEFREMADAYIEHVAHKRLTPRENLNLIAARFLIGYTQFTDLPADFVTAGRAGDVWLCGGLWSLGEAFCPEQSLSDLDPLGVKLAPDQPGALRALKEKVDTLSIPHQEGGKGMKRRARDWNDAVNDAVKRIMVEHADWDDEKIAEEVIKQLPSNVLKLIVRKPKATKSTTRAAFAQADADLRRLEKVKKCVGLLRKSNPS